MDGRIIDFLWILPLEISLWQSLFCPYWHILLCLPGWILPAPK
jgi:hypothetical protein